VEKTASGTLRVKGKLTKTGVFEYKRDDSIIRELRSAEEVFSEAALDTLRGAHVTIDHPRDFVDSDNWKMHSVGTVLNATAEPPYVVGELAVHDGRAQHLIECGTLKEISCGYFMRPQTLDGVEADFAQTEIRYNHAALGPSGWGRLGSDVGLTLDSNSDQKLPRFNMSDKESVEQTTDQAELPLVEPPPLRKEVRALDKKVDGVADALARLIDRLEAKEEDSKKKAYTEVSEKPSPEEIQDSIGERARDLVGLELRARSAYEAVFPKRKTIDNTELWGKQYCEEILGYMDSKHGYELKELVERAEISAHRAKAERETIQRAEDAQRRDALLGLPPIQPNTDPLRALILGE